MPNLTLIPLAEFQRVRGTQLDPCTRLELLADMCRANTLTVVKRAGSGHLGSSLSAMDMVIWLYHREMNTVAKGITHPDRDIYFSSKGHDVPGLYAVLHSFGIIPEERLLKLRRYGGLDGHPDVGVPGIEANSGSLGMGISKGRGMAWAKRYRGRDGRVFVMTGDGELQEGQNFEALQAAVHQKVNNLTVIVDHNKLQSDKLVCEILDLGNLNRKFEAFGWHVVRCDGHDFRQLERAFAEFKMITDKPKLLIADTIKGRGISFMEHPVALKLNNGSYRWHAGAPDDQSFEAAYQEVTGRLQQRFQNLGLPPLVLTEVPPEVKAGGVVVAKQSLAGEPLSPGNKEAKPASGASDEYVVEAYGQALVDLAAQRKDLIVLDGDLAADCRVRKFENTHAGQFIENGIAEQDMVSMAGGLARQGLLPVVNSFASFLAARANEQIYNNATEKSRIIYACTYGGLIPAGPGKSHQSIRDISLFGALPNLTILQPCNAIEARMVVDYCVIDAAESCMIRMNIGPSPRVIELPEGYTLTPGRGAVLTGGNDAILVGYGPVMLHEALLAGEIFSQEGLGLCVVNMPWLNRFDTRWLRELLVPFSTVYVIEDHAPVGGLGDGMMNALMAEGQLAGRRLVKFAVEGFPACGTPAQALRHHRLDGASLVERIAADIGMAVPLRQAG